MSKKLIFCLLSCALFFASNAHASEQQLPPQLPLTHDQYFALLIFSCQRKKPMPEEQDKPQKQEQKKQYRRKEQKPPRSDARKSRVIKQSREEEEEPKSEDWLQEQAKLVAQHVATLQ